MANAMYTGGITGIMDGSIDLLTNVIKVMLINTSNYTFNAGHTTLSNIPASAQKGYGTLASKTVSSGAFDAADTVISGINADDVNAAIVYSETANKLICYLDTGFSATGALANNTVTVEWNAGTNKIFKIG